MNTAREAIAQIEATLGSDIEAAALKRDLNKMVLALTDSVRNLVVVAKEMADAFDALGGSAPVPSTPATRKKPAAKKTPIKRTQKQPIKPA